MVRASECTPWKVLRRKYRDKKGLVNIYIHWRMCRLPPLLGQVGYAPSRNICDVRISTPNGKVVYRDRCRCEETGRRRVDNWIRGASGWQ